MLTLRSCYVCASVCNVTAMIHLRPSVTTRAKENVGASISVYNLTNKDVASFQEPDLPLSLRINGSS